MPNDLDESGDQFRFAISLSVLNHLGRNLYRNFVTVLGEAISNSWDAGAKNVWIDIDREVGMFSIKDDGEGMSPDDFQNKFLKIGYSKRKEVGSHNAHKRPFIGAKGIGKLALLSCAKRISVFSKEQGGDYVGGVIDNSGLDEAITKDLEPEEYPLEELDFSLIGGLVQEHDHGTIIVFVDAKEQIRNSIAHIRKMLAMSFRFSVIDPEFTIHVNGEAVGLSDLQDLADSTEFVWQINKYKDDYIEELKNLKEPFLEFVSTLDARGFLASVQKPRHLKISGTDDRATVDLFVNGRLREKNILRHIPTQRIVESYLYGQMHFDSMDSGGVDPFTSSREGVVEDDENFQALLDYLKNEVLPSVIDKWDELRLKHRGGEGDDENPRKSKKERRAQDLFLAAKAEFAPDDDAPSKNEVDAWLSSLRTDAEYNIASYIDCFLSENLLRKFISEKKIELPAPATTEIESWQDREAVRKEEAKIAFSIRQGNDPLSYLGMNFLAATIDGKKDPNVSSFYSDAISYRPIRNVVGHTGLLTDEAKAHLRLNHANVIARVKAIVSGAPLKP